MRVYLDNASTTFLDKDVLETMMPYMNTLCGNPSSIHDHGRKAKVAIEKSRKDVASLLGVSPSEIFFTSGGTEGNNMLLMGAVRALGLKNVITSKIEHHAVLNLLKQMANEGIINLHFVRLDECGRICYNHLEDLLKKNDKSLVSLMHANNEIGNLNDLVSIGELCKTYNSIFHTDSVQTIGHYKMNLQSLPVHLAAGSAHKFHGPKGIGLVYIKGDIKIAPLIYGGYQERDMRGGTENVPGIVGLCKALQIAYDNIERDKEYIQCLKDRMINSLKNKIVGIEFNGESESPEKSIYTILSVSLPSLGGDDMLVFNLDIRGISASVGSACASGSSVGSHVLEALGTDPQRNAVRFSFSKYNTIDEIDYTVEQLAEVFNN